MISVRWTANILGTFYFLNEKSKESLIALTYILTLDPNISYNILHDVIQNAKNKHMTYKLVTYRKYKHKKSKWITQGIIKSMHYRDNMDEKHKMTDPNSIQFAIQKTNVNTYNNI